jgi:hypothetical protein
MLTELITAYLSPFHDFKKLCIRKPANFPEKSKCLFVVDKSNDYMIRNIKHIISYYRFKVFGTHIGNS